MIRLIAAGLALLGLAAACGGNTEEAAPPATTAPYTGAADAPEREAAPAPARPSRSRRVLVTVVDGDTHRRVRGARVVIGERADYANTRGLASVPIKRAHGAAGSRLEARLRGAGRAHALQAQRR